jgi:hypothetical protein
MQSLEPHPGGPAAGDPPAKTTVGRGGRDGRAGESAGGGLETTSKSHKSTRKAGLEETGSSQKSSKSLPGVENGWFALRGSWFTIEQIQFVIIPAVRMREARADFAQILRQKL